MKKHFTTILLVLILIIGLSLLLYPSVSNYWNSLHQSRAISNYVEAVSKIDDETYQQILNDAYEYNRSLYRFSYALELTDEQTEEYDRQLDVMGTGLMGYIEIKKINCFLPIYHGTGEEYLQIAIGHIPGSSLPVGGENTHCVLSGHRGLPSARLFTDLDKLEIGDTFVLRTLDETLTYEVDETVTVLPQEADSLSIVPGEDLCTLITCTPYGLNTHRLLVRGHRVENERDSASIRVTGDAVRVKPVLVAPAVAAPVLIVLLIMLFVSPGKKKRK